MTVRLTVRREEWERHVGATATAYGPGLVPVVKGNGYGFGRATLLPIAAGLGSRVCVGSVHELAGVPHDLIAVVLTPTLHPPAERAPDTTIFTVGDPAHVAALAGLPGSRVMVKLASTMHRYGSTTEELPALLAAVDTAGMQVAAFALHLPLAGADAARLAEIEAWLPHLSAEHELWVSHLQPEAFVALQKRHPSRTFRIRVGTALWHGIPKGRFLQLSADVLSTQPVRAGDAVGYFATPAPADGTVVAVGAGSAHGVAPLDNDDPSRRSPFHFARHRVALLETPHMHTTMLFVPSGQLCPAVGERVDLQRPLISTLVDEVEWA